MRLRHRVAVTVVSLLVLALAPHGHRAMVPPASAQAPPDAALTAEVELGGGAIVELPLESVDPTGFIFLDLQQPDVLLNVINGCALNDRFWVLAANLTDTPATLTITATADGSRRTFSLPARPPDGPADPIIGLEALPICDDIDISGVGIGELAGTAQYTGVGERCSDMSRPIVLTPRDRGGAFREISLAGSKGHRIISRDPVVVTDDGGSQQEIILFAEARLPGRVEGVAVTGPGRLLPRRATLDKRLGRVTDGRVRRAFETALNGRVPRALIDELGLRSVQCVYHVRLDFPDADAKDRLFAAGWLKEDPEISAIVEDEPAGGPAEGSTSTDGVTGPTEDDRFIVEIIDTDGRLDEIPLASAPSDRDSAIRTWLFRDPETLAQVIDACAYTDTFWTLLGSRSEAGFEASVVDLVAEESSSYSVAQALGGSLAPAVVDTAAFATCR